MSVEIPAEPIDGHRVDWWVLNHDHAELVHHHAIYHVDTPFAEVEPDSWLLEDGRYVPPFHQQFALYERGKLDGRSGGWDSFRHSFKDNSWDTEGMAIIALKQAIARTLEHHEGEATKYRRRLREVILEQLKTAAKAATPKEQHDG